LSYSVPARDGALGTPTTTRTTATPIAITSAAAGAAITSTTRSSQAGMVIHHV